MKKPTIHDLLNYFLGAMFLVVLAAEIVGCAATSCPVPAVPSNKIAAMNQSLVATNFRPPFIRPMSPVTWSLNFTESLPQPTAIGTSTVVIQSNVIMQADKPSGPWTPLAYFPAAGQSVSFSIQPLSNKFFQVQNVYSIITNK